MGYNREDYWLSLVPAGADADRRRLRALCKHCDRAYVSPAREQGYNLERQWAAQAMQKVRHTANCALVLAAEHAVAATERT